MSVGQGGGLADLLVAGCSLRHVEQGQGEGSDAHEAAVAVLVFACASGKVGRGHLAHAGYGVRRGGAGIENRAEGREAPLEEPVLEVPASLPDVEAAGDKAGRQRQGKRGVV